MEVIMNTITIPIDQINAAAYNPRVDLQPGDPPGVREVEASHRGIRLCRAHHLERAHRQHCRRSSAVQDHVE